MVGSQLPAIRHTLLLPCYCVWVLSEPGHLAPNLFLWYLANTAPWSFHMHLLGFYASPPPPLLPSRLSVCLKLLSTPRSRIHEWHHQVLKSRLTPLRKWLTPPSHIPLLSTGLKSQDTISSSWPKPRRHGAQLPKENRLAYIEVMRSEPSKAGIFQREHNLLSLRLF